MVRVARFSGDQLRANSMRQRSPTEQIGRYRAARTNEGRGGSVNVALWLVGVALGLVFLAAGAMKLRKTKAQLLEMDPKNMGWTEDFTDVQIRVHGQYYANENVGLTIDYTDGQDTFGDVIAFGARWNF